MKLAHVRGHQFDCLPGHIECSGNGEGSNLRAAVAAAVRDMLTDPALKHRKIHTFKITVVVDSKEEG